MPLIIDGQCLAHCKFAIDADAPVDRYIELLEVLAENVNARLSGHVESSTDSIDDDIALSNEPLCDARNDGWSDVVHQAVDLIHAQFANPDLSVATVARHLGLNRDYLSHLFRIQTGQRMSREIFLRRMQHARSLLLTTNLQVRQIALASGFLNTDWFSHTFHVLEGVTPSQFRRKSRQH